MDNRGGFATIKVGYAHKLFSDGVNRNVGSLHKDWTKRSFTISKTIAWHKKLSLEKYNPPEVGLVAPYDNEKESQLDKINNPTSFL